MLAYPAARMREETTRWKTADIIRIEQARESERAVVHSDRQLVELSPEAILVYRHHRLTLLNQAAGRLLGAHNASELLGRSLFDFVHSEFHALFHEIARLPPANATSTPFMEQVWMRRDGTHFHAEIAASNLIYDGLPAVQIVVRDISDRKRNEAVQLGQNRILNMVATGAELPAILTEIARFVESQSDQGLCSIQVLDGGGATVNADADKASASWPISGNEGNLLGTLALTLPETEAPSAAHLELLSICARLAGIAIETRASEEKIRFLAHYDELTSLPNRFLFREYFDTALLNAQRRGSRFAVFFIDFDKFKEINDNFGHAAGDHVLREIAARLRAALRDTDKIARMGGDEFCVLIEDLQDDCDAAHIAQKLLDAASRPVYLDSQEYRLSVSIGIAIYPEHGTEANTLLQNADSAMYCAKELGKNRYRYYSAGL
jgi:diguanylate cyclase (GGDEF)-like protein/PAS domain S-box-containing protein